jgi:hypothetical protein
VISISVSLIFACKFQSLIGVKINWNAVGFWDCGEAKGGINNQFLITGFSIIEKNPSLFKMG